MSKIKVSVIVPIFNKEAYLKECLDSLINQSLKEIEIICVNDGSTDNSLTILKEYSQKDSRIIISNQDNNGPGNARNNGLKKSKGEYVAFIDADDWIELDTLKKVYENAKENDSDLVLFNAIEHLPDKNYRKRIYYPENIEGTFDFNEKKDLVMNNYLIVCTKLHKLSFLQENNIEFSNSDLFEDVYFHVKSIIKAKKISYLNTIFYNYRRTNTNTRQSNSLKSDTSQLFLDVLERIKQLLLMEELFEYLKVNYYEFKLTQLNNLFNNNPTDEFFNRLKLDFENDASQIYNLEISKSNQLFFKNIISSENLQTYLKIVKTGDKSEKSNSLIYIIKKLKNYFIYF